MPDYYIHDQIHIHVYVYNYVFFCIRHVLENVGMAWIIISLIGILVHIMNFMMYQYTNIKVVLIIWKLKGSREVSYFVLLVIEDK